MFVCMYVCINIYMLHMCAQMHVDSVCAYIYIYIHIFTYICIYIYMKTYLYATYVCECP